MRFVNVTDRLLDKFTVGDGCWEWTSAVSHNGYGTLWVGKGKGTGYAHRLVYELLVGPVPEGLDLDHLCRVRHCVRPSHLEPVDRRENVLRGDGIAGRNAKKTACSKGHEYTPENTYRWGGRRFCRACNRIYKTKGLQ